MKGLCLIPAFNEESVISKVVSQVPKKVGVHKIDVLVVDDGSTDKTAQRVRKTRANLISHPINRGLGAALGTGFEFARKSNYQFLITLDGDGQHDPAEIEKIIKPIVNNKAQFVVGTRAKKSQEMPVYRKLMTFLASVVTFTLTGVWTSDSQSGFRAFSKEAISKIFIEVDRMEVSSYFFQRAKQLNLKFEEVPIKPIYTQYSIKKGQRFSNSFNILGKLILQRILD